MCSVLVCSGYGTLQQRRASSQGGAQVRSKLRNKEKNVALFEEVEPPVGRARLAAARELTCEPLELSLPACLSACLTACLSPPPVSLPDCLSLPYLLWLRGDKEPASCCSRTSTRSEANPVAGRVHTFTGCRQTVLAGRSVQHTALQ